MNGMTGTRTLIIGGNRESYIASLAIHDLPGCDVIGVVVPGGRLKERTSDIAPEISDLCLARSVPMYETHAINDPSTIQWMVDREPDVTITLGWSELYGTDILEAALGLIVGSHPSALPYGRGRAPIPWTILEGLERSAVTLFEMNLGVDSGPILQQEWFDVPLWAHAAEVYDRSAEALGAACVRLLRAYADGSIERQSQDEDLATYRHGRRPEDGLLDFSRTAEELSSLIRAASRPYPGAFCFVPSGEKLTVHRTSPPTDLDNRHRGVPGQVLRVNDGRIVVQAADGPVVLEDLDIDSGPDSIRVDTRLSPRGRI